MDTITFFRIQEGDKQLIEKEYQQKLKNAIWSAVPNIGMIVAGGNAVTMAISLASQVGIGYMNYRRQKATINQETERQRWQLERTAIEQFNGLRRELFDTAWRLSDTYGFPDQLRLTERQIRQYNDILMDGDILRRYDRLDAVKEYFIAYPPFWYQFGSTANAIGHGKLPIGPQARTYYLQKAKEHFLQYWESNQKGLLREDMTSASCALELADLLDPKKDKKKILELLDNAISFSGHANDVMQLAVITYLKLNEPNKAAMLLNRLVNEQYNTIFNAQLLSSIFVSQFISVSSDDALRRYRVLSQRVGDTYLYPMPRKLEISQEEMQRNFLSKQKAILMEKYTLVLENFIRKYTICFHHILPSCNEDVIYPDAYYLDDDNAAQLRKDDLEKVLSNPGKIDHYNFQLRNISLPYSLLDLLNKMFDALCYLDVMSEAVRSNLVRDIQYSIIENRDMINSLNSKFNSNGLSLSDTETLYKLRFRTFTKEFFRNFQQELKMYINSRDEMQDFAIAEHNL